MFEAVEIVGSDSHCVHIVEVEARYSQLLGCYLAISTDFKQRILQLFCWPISEERWLSKLN